MSFHFVFKKISLTKHIILKIIIEEFLSHYKRSIALSQQLWKAQDTIKMKICISITWGELFLTFRHWSHFPNFPRFQTEWNLDDLNDSFSYGEYSGRAHLWGRMCNNVCWVLDLPHSGSVVSPLIPLTICLSTFSNPDCLVLCWFLACPRMRIWAWWH